jgi:hypothetical protein
VRQLDQRADVVAGAGDEALEAGADIELAGGVWFGLVCAGLLWFGDGGVVAGAVAGDAGEDAPGCMSWSSLLRQPPAASRTMERTAVA